MRRVLESWAVNTFKWIKSTSQIGIIVDLVYLFIFIGISIIISYIIKKVFYILLKKLTRKTKSKWLKAIIETRNISRIFYLLPGIIVYRVASFLIELRSFVELVAVIYISIIFVATLFALLDIINLIYEGKVIDAKKKPIKGLVTIFKTIILITTLIIIVSKIMGQSPIYILSALGALSAVFMLVFKDSLLGIVAGVQISTNDLIRIGDWIEVPKYEADGDVIDISLTIVKVRNFDKTITTVPAYALVSNSFKNWRGMQNWGGRRIKRALKIDISSIKFCSENLLEKLETIVFLQRYLQERRQEVAAHNTRQNIDTSMPVNGRRLTNIGTFRRYIMEYLKEHPYIHKEMIVMVRQMEPSKDGVPLEVYAFTSTIIWAEYENIVSDIFDHLFAVAPFFDLRIFQQPTGSDIQMLKQKDDSAYINMNQQE